MDDEPVEEPTAEVVESVDEETASEEIELTAEETPEAGEAPEQPERPAVERDKAKVRALTREERELYAPFIQSRSAREQLVKAIDNISLAAYTGNVIITGEEGMDTLSLAKNMVREIQATDSNFSGKVAKISGHALNKKDTADTLSKLKNGALIICKASEMNDAACEQAVTTSGRAGDGEGTAGIGGSAVWSRGHGSQQRDVHLPDSEYFILTADPSQHDRLPQSVRQCQPRGDHCSGAGGHTVQYDHCHHLL